MRDITKPFAAILAALLFSTTVPCRASDLPSMDGDIAALQHDWARIKYATTDQKAQADQMTALAAQSKSVAAKYPERAEPLIWSAIITSSAAGIKGGLSALGLVGEARDMLEKAEKINANALDGSALTSLGSLYDQVPGFPIGFGSAKKARQYLERAIAVNPDGIDSNFFYGSFLAGQGDYAKAEVVLHHALAAPNRPDRSDADAGRRLEIQAMLDGISAKAKKKKKS